MKMSKDYYAILIHVLDLFLQFSFQDASIHLQIVQIKLQLIFVISMCSYFEMIHKIIEKEHLK